MKSALVFSIGLAILAALLMLPWIPRPFTGHHDFVGAFNSQMARNYLRYGFLATKLGQVTNFGTVAPSAFSFHTHHPPGVPLFLAFVYRLFGEHEWVARGSVAVFAVGSTVLLFLMTSDATSLLVGTIATLLMITTPIFVYPSILPVYEAPALFFMLLQIFCFKRWVSSEKRVYLTLFVVGAIVGYITAWVTYVTVPILIAERVFSRSSRGFKLLIVLFFTSILFFGLHLPHTKMLTGDWFGGGLDAIFLRRVGVSPDPNPAFGYTTRAYLEALLFRLKNFYGVPLLAISLAGIGVIFATRFALEYREPRHSGVIPTFGRENDRISSSNQKDPIASLQDDMRSTRLLFLLTGVALALPVLFRNYVFVHDYLLYYSVPLMGFTAAIGITAVLRVCKTAGFIKGETTTALVTAIALVGITTFATRITWKDLWESIEWDATSPIIGGHLRRTTTSDQQILIVNQPLREEETNLQYYADRAVSFPAPGDTGPFDPDVMVNVTSDYQFPEDYKSKILESYRLEVDQSVEYYYRK